MNLHIKQTQNKHESEIPSLDVKRTINLFCTTRELFLTKIMKTQQIKEKFIINEFDQEIKRLYEATSERCLLQSEVDYVFTLEKRFVITGNLYLKSLDEKVDKVIDGYFYLAGILLNLYTNEHDFNALNSAVRVLDKASLLFNDDAVLSDVPTAICVLGKEKEVLSLKSETL